MGFAMKCGRDVQAIFWGDFQGYSTEADVSIRTYPARSPVGEVDGGRRIAGYVPLGIHDGS
jgi:hypothetical protein